MSIRGTKRTFRIKTGRGRRVWRRLNTWHLEWLELRTAPGSFLLTLPGLFSLPLLEEEEFSSAASAGDELEKELALGNRQRQKTMVPDSSPREAPGLQTRAVSQTVGPDR